MNRITVCYGQPSDPADFDRHYAQVHAPLASKVPGLAAYTGSVCASLDGSAPAYYFIATLDFATEEDYKAALTSPEMAEAVADVPTFASGGVTMLTQRIDDLLAAG